MYRKLMAKLAEWKENTERKPLIVRGARQVGKTWLMKKFGQEYYKNCAYLMLDGNQSIKEILEEGFCPEKIKKVLEKESGCVIEPEKTLIIFDEIQEQPIVMKALKYFKEQMPQYHIVAAGSYLGIQLHTGTAFPVGSVEFCDLYPMDFEEFLIACGESRLAQVLHAKDRDKMGLFKNQYIDLLKYYYFVGGMPAAVQMFCVTRDLRDVRNIQEHLLESYENDFSKHTSPAMAIKMKALWKRIPARLAQGQKIAGWKDFDDAEEILQWLLDSGLVYKVDKIRGNEMPYRTYRQSGEYKIFLLDIGLLGAMTGLNAKTIIKGNKMFSEFQGILSRQYVIQQLMPDAKNNIYYWVSDTSNGEIDFLLDYEDGLVPVDIPVNEYFSGRNLKSYCNKYHPEMAVRTSISDYHVKDWMTNIPLYGIGVWRSFLWDN